MMGPSKVSHCAGMGENYAGRNQSSVLFLISNIKRSVPRGNRRVGGYESLTPASTTPHSFFRDLASDGHHVRRGKPHLGS